LWGPTLQAIPNSQVGKRCWPKWGTKCRKLMKKKGRGADGGWAHVKDLLTKKKPGRIEGTYIIWKEKKNAKNRNAQGGVTS